MEKPSLMARLRAYIRGLWFAVKWYVWLWVVIFAIAVPFAGVERVFWAADAMAVFALLVIMWRFLRKEWRDAGVWRRDRLSRNVVGLCVLLGVAYCLCYNGLLLAIFSANGDESLASQGNTAFTAFVLFMHTKLLAPVTEELLFRGTILRRLRGFGVKAAPALVVQALLFAVMHLDGGWASLLYAFVMGMLFGSVYLYFGSVWASMAAHLAANLFGSVLTVIFNAAGGGAAWVWLLFSLLGLAGTIVLMRTLKRRRVASEPGATPPALPEEDQKTAL